MEFQVEIKRTQIAKLTFSVPDGDTEAAEEQAAAWFSTPSCIRRFSMDARPTTTTRWHPRTLLGL